jgi:hypothetical protein
VSLVVRVVLGVAGTAAAAYGAWLLRDDSLDTLVGIATWLVSGVLLHDLLLAPLTVVLVVVAARWLPAGWRAPAAAALVVVGSTTLWAVPVLGRFGARPDNPTLLDRNYLAGWALVVGLTLLATLAWARLRSGRSGRGPGARG